jgi:hypothetical protein
MWGRFHSIQRNADQFRAKPAENLFVAFDYNAPPQTWQPVIRLSKKGERDCEHAPTIYQEFNLQCTSVLVHYVSMRRGFENEIRAFALRLDAHRRNVCNSVDLETPVKEVSFV